MKDIILELSYVDLAKLEKAEMKQREVVRCLIPVLDGKNIVIDYCYN